MARFTFITKSKSVECEIGGEKVAFWPLRLQAIVELRSIAKPLVQAISTLFLSSRGEDSVKVVTSTKDGTIEQITNPPAAPSILARRDERDGAIAQALDALLKPESIGSILEIVADSLRLDESDRGLLRAEADLQTLPALLAGVYEANKGLFRPLAGLLGRAKAVMAPTAPAAQEALEGAEEAGSTHS